MRDKIRGRSKGGWGWMERMTLGIFFRSKRVVGSLMVSSFYDLPVPFSIKVTIFSLYFNTSVQIKWNFSGVTLISFGFWINFRPFQHQVSPQRRGGRRGRFFLLLQSGDGDWSRNSVPSGLRSIPLMTVVPIMSLVLRNGNLFIWRYLSAK